MYQHGQNETEGLSTGPCLFSSTDEIIECFSILLLQAVARVSIWCSHLQSVINSDYSPAFFLAKRYELFSIVVGLEVTVFTPDAYSLISIFGIVNVQL